MGAFGRLLISRWGGDIDSYNGTKSSKKKQYTIRIAKCSHCLQITEQCPYHERSLVYNKANDDRWYCFNCETLSDVGQCNCGNCISHPYNKTGLTKKDITNL